MKQKTNIIISFLLIACVLLSLFSCGSRTEKGEAVVTGIDLVSAADESASTESPESETEEPYFETVSTTETEPPGPETEKWAGRPWETERIPDGEIDPFFWHIRSENGGELYLLGTIHVGDERTSDICKAAYRYIDKCGAIAVECDVIEYQNDPLASAAYLRSLMYKDGTTIKDHLSSEVYEKLTAFAKDHGFGFPYLESYDLSMWSSLIEEIILDEYTDLKTDKGVDVQLMHYVKKNGLELIELESVEFQNELLASFGDELYEMQIEAMLEDPAEEGRATSELYEMYLIGDVDLTGSLTGKDPDESGEELTEREKELIEGYEKALLDDRNLGMRDKAVEMLESGKTVFYTAGLAHFLGEKGLVKLLTDEGYEVERVHIFDLVSVSA